MRGLISATRLYKHFLSDTIEQTCVYHRISFWVAEAVAADAAAAVRLGAHVRARQRQPNAPGHSGILGAGTGHFRTRVHLVICDSEQVSLAHLSLLRYPSRVYHEPLSLPA